MSFMNGPLACLQLCAEGERGGDQRLQARRLVEGHAPPGQQGDAPRAHRGRHR